jgi:glucosyl-3-phosphoglycerate phosphatase
VTRLYIWRHGRTAWNAEHRIQGQTDVPLDEIGHAQARAAAERLARHQPDVLIASDLRRAAQTAQYLADVTGLPVEYDARLRERHFGAWQGLTDEELAEQYPAGFERWRSGDRSVAEEIGMESLEDLEKRATAAFIDAAQANPGGRTVIAAHGGTAKYGVAALLGWSVDVSRTVGSLANCHWIELRDTPRRGWQLWAYNAE